MTNEIKHIHFVTGRLAEHAVKDAVQRCAQKFDFEFSVEVLPITVAALMTPDWLLKRVRIPAVADTVVLPGHLDQDLTQLQEKLGTHVQCGPRDIRDLPVFFGGKRVRDESYGDFRIQILAEINHAPKLSISQLLEQAHELVTQGADLIDLGCIPGKRWAEIGTAVRELTAAGTRVSVDSFDTWEVATACAQGAELVLSVNSSNRHLAADWGTEVVVIPDHPTDKKSFQESIDFLAKRGVRMRLDPILEPIGCGFANSLARYVNCRREYPDANMMMGIGNLTELTDADSAGINVLLLGVCEELKIDSVLTTQVINWARTSVQECDLARRLVHFACRHGIPPKHLEPKLIALRDERINEFSVDTLTALANAIRDHNVRVFAAEGEIHAVSAAVHVHDEDPFAVMEQLLSSQIGGKIDVSHAFYLGFEMSKALTANTLDKQYTQDQALDWGFLTRPEDLHRLQAGRSQHGANRPGDNQKPNDDPRD